MRYRAKAHSRQHKFSFYYDFPSFHCCVCVCVLNMWWLYSFMAQCKPIPTGGTLSTGSLFAPSEPKKGQKYCEGFPRSKYLSLVILTCLLSLYLRGEWGAWGDLFDKLLWLECTTEVIPGRLAGGWGGRKELVLSRYPRPIELTNCLKLYPL